MATTDQIKALYRCRFDAFLRFAYRELHPNQKLIETWHLDVLAEHLDRVAKGEIKRLIINLPPRMLKSHAASVALPVWLLGRDPTKTILSIAGTKELAQDLDRATRTLISTPRCLALYPHLKSERGGKGRDLMLPHGGKRLSAVVRGSLIGRGADVIIIDDPITPVAAADDARRRAVNRWFDAEVLQRLNNKRTGAVIVIMQRLHHDDLTGHLLAQETPWVHLNMPAIAVGDERWPSIGGQTIERRQGSCLAGPVESKQQLFEHMLDIGAYAFGAQFQQAPVRHQEPDERRSGCFVDGTDPYGFETFAMSRVSERAIMAHEVFGVGAQHPARHPKNLTMDEFERLSALTADYQRRLKEDPEAPWLSPRPDTEILAEWQREKEELEASWKDMKDEDRD